MAIFDYYVMVDWSGGGRRRGNRADAIWIAHGARNAIPDGIRAGSSEDICIRSEEGWILGVL